MRILFTILFVTILLPTSYAQTSDLMQIVVENEDNQQLLAFRKHVRSILQRQHTTQKLKTTIQKQRVISESSYNPAPPAYLYDTTIYRYTGINGSSFDLNYMLFNYSYPPTIEPASYPYDYSGIDVMADTITFQSRLFSTDTLKTHHEIAVTYNVNDKLTSYKTYFFEKGLPDSGVLYYQTYNSQGQLSEVLAVTDTLLAVDTACKLRSYYDAQGRKDKDSMFLYAAANWLPAASVSYTYDGAGNITSVITEEFTGTSWIPETKYEHTFYADNSLMTATWFQYDGTSFAPMRRDTFEYASGSTFFTTRTEYYFGSNGWTPSQQTSKFLNAQGVPDTVYSSYFDALTSSWTHFEKQQFTYNADKNPVQRNWYSFDGLNWSLIEIHNYYYEEYTVGINELAKQVNISVYPNPASDEITITWKDGVGKNVCIELHSASGQKVMTRSCIGDKQREKVSIQHLASGLYLLILKNDTGMIFYNQRIIRR